jgi:ketosteroid isomerase-like protein
MSRLTTALVAVVLLAVAVAGVLVVRGSGSSSDEDAVEQVLSDLESASREGDSARICEQIFTPKLAAAVSRSSDGGSCAAEVEAQLFAPDAEITVDSVEVSDGSDAEATITEANGNASRVFLVKQDGEWRIRSVTPA